MKKRITEGTWSKWLFWFSIVAASIVLYKSFDRLSDIFGLVGSLVGLLGPIVAAFVIAFFLNRPMGYIERRLKNIRKIPFISNHARGFSVILVYIIFLVVVALIVYAIVPSLISGITSLIANSDQYIESASAWFASISEQYPFIAAFDIGDTLIGWAKAFIAGINIDTLIKYIESIGSVGSTVADIAVSLFVSVYMLLDKESICAALKRIGSLVLKEKTIRAISSYLLRANAVVYRYFATQFADCVIVSVLATIALSILDTPSPMLLGFIFGMFNIIPYFGPIIGGVGVVIVILFSRGFGLALTATIILLVLQQLDANVINPRILGESLEIGPFWVIVAITLGGGLFGFAGMLLGVPTMVVARMIYRDALRFKRHWRHQHEAARKSNVSDEGEGAPQDESEMVISAMEEVIAEGIQEETAQGKDAPESPAAPKNAGQNRRKKKK